MYKEPAKKEKSSPSSTNAFSFLAGSQNRIHKTEKLSMVRSNKLSSWLLQIFFPPHANPPKNLDFILVPAVMVYAPSPKVFPQTPFLYLTPLDRYSYKTGGHHRKGGFACSFFFLKNFPAKTTPAGRMLQ